MATAANSLDVLKQVAAQSQATPPPPTADGAQPQNSMDVLKAVAADPNYGHSDPTDTGEQKNEIGKTIIVPKENEDFTDTMKRAAAQGKKTTQKDIDDEMVTAVDHTDAQGNFHVGKAAQVLAAAPAIGVAGAAGLAGAGEAGAAIIEHVKSILPDKATADAVIKVSKIVRDLGLTAAAGRYLYHTIYGN